MPYGVVIDRKDKQGNSYVRPFVAGRHVILSESYDHGFVPGIEVFYNPSDGVFDQGRTVDFAHNFIPIPRGTNTPIDDRLREIIKNRMAHTDIEGFSALLIVDPLQTVYPIQTGKTSHYITIARGSGEAIRAAWGASDYGQDWSGDYGISHHKGSNGLFGRRSFELSGSTKRYRHGDEKTFFDRDDHPKKMHVIGIEGIVSYEEKRGYRETFIPDEAFRLCVESARLK